MPCGSLLAWSVLSRSVGVFLPVLGPFSTHLYSLDGAPNPFAIFWIVRGHPLMAKRSKNVAHELRPNNSAINREFGLSSVQGPTGGSCRETAPRTSPKKHQPET
jgi:hypothetical protein